MKFLVFGATGTVGSEVTRELLSRGHGVRSLTRNPEKAAMLGTGIEAVKGDLLEPATLRGAFDGVDGAFLINPVSTTESHEGLIALTAAMVAGLKRIVYMSVQHAERAAHLPHFGSKVGIETAIKGAKIPYTILRPSNFYQNDTYFRDVIMKYGVYPQPLGGKGVSRVDTRDIGELAAIALTQSGHEGKTYDVVGPQSLTGEYTAKVWSDKLGRKIFYGGDDLDAWQAQAGTMLPAWMAYDFRHMYAHFQASGMNATPEEVAALTRLLGHAPRSFENYAAEMAKAWTAEGAAVGGRS